LNGFDFRSESAALQLSAEASRLARPACSRV
jgi:hypothetical protein